MGTKENPGEFDCHGNAESDEPVFTLVARDPSAPDTIRNWCRHRVFTGKNKISDEQIREALECADNMEDWRMRNRS